MFTNVTWPPRVIVTVDGLTAPLLPMVMVALLVAPPPEPPGPPEPPEPPLGAVGPLPPPHANGTRYLVTPLNALRPADELGQPLPSGEVPLNTRPDCSSRSR